MDNNKEKEYLVDQKFPEFAKSKNWKNYAGDSVLPFIKEIGENIDFVCFNLPVYPGERLIYLEILPFLKKKCDNIF